VLVGVKAGKISSIGAGEYNFYYCADADVDLQQQRTVIILSHKYRALILAAVMQV
jgi:hypothetical protein